MSQSLILQSPHLASAQLLISEHYFDLPDTLPDTVLRLSVNHDYERVPAAAAAEFQQQQIDYALIPDTPFAALKLVVRDMDSTLITIECIDEIADSAGLKDQIAEITERAMQGELDFEQSLRRRVALLQGQPENRLAEVYAHKLALSEGAEDFIRARHQILAGIGRLHLFHRPPENPLGAGLGVCQPVGNCRWQAHGQGVGRCD